MSKEYLPEEDKKWLVVDEALLILTRDSRKKYWYESGTTKIIDHYISLLEKIIEVRKARLSEDINKN